MQRLEVSGAVRPIYGSLGVKRLTNKQTNKQANKHVGFAVKFKAYILEVLGWHLVRNTGQCEFPQGFSWSLHANTEELSTVELHLSGCWISESPVIRIGLVLRANLSRILQNYLASKLPVISSSTGQCYGFKNLQSRIVERFRRSYLLQIVAAELQTANIAYFQRKIQLSGFSAYPDGSASQLIRISGVLPYQIRV